MLGRFNADPSYVLLYALKPPNTSSVHASLVISVMSRNLSAPSTAKGDNYVEIMSQKCTLDAPDDFNFLICSPCASICDLRPEASVVVAGILSMNFFLQSSQKPLICLMLFRSELWIVHMTTIFTEEQE
jgi:hypothetical protein